MKNLMIYRVLHLFQATVEACTQILKKLDPIKQKMKNPTWKDLIFKAYEENVNLYARYT